MTVRQLNMRTLRRVVHAENRRRCTGMEMAGAPGESVAPRRTCRQRGGCDSIPHRIAAPATPHDRPPPAHVARE